MLLRCVRWTFAATSPARPRPGALLHSARWRVFRFSLLPVPPPQRRALALHGCTRNAIRKQNRTRPARPQLESDSEMGLFTITTRSAGRGPERPRRIIKRKVMNPGNCSCQLSGLCPAD